MIPVFCPEYKPSLEAALFFIGLIECTKVLPNACMNPSLHEKTKTKHPHICRFRHTPGLWFNNIFPGTPYPQLWLTCGKIKCWRNFGINASLPTSSHLYMHTHWLGQLESPFICSPYNEHFVLFSRISFITTSDGLTRLSLHCGISSFWFI